MISNNTCRILSVNSVYVKMNSSGERQRKLTRLRVQKHRAVQKELLFDRYRCNDNDASDSSISSDRSIGRALDTEPAEEPIHQIDVLNIDNTEQLAATLHGPSTSNASSEVDDSEHTTAAPERSFSSANSSDSQLRNMYWESSNSPGSIGINEQYDNEVEDIKRWAIESNISGVDLDILLKILRRRLLPQLPKSSKTFLGTAMAKYNVVEMDDCSGESGQFVYLGITDGLYKCVNEELHKAGDTLQLQFNIDGMPIAKSSFTQMWPILCKVFYTPDIYKPFPVAIYCGASKPKSIDNYLEQFIEEMNGLCIEGIVFSDKNLKVCIHSFICDTPARSMLKCVKGHTGFYACERCDVEGFKVNWTTVFPSVDSEERTDETFRGQQHMEHHNNNGPSPLLRLQPPIDMVKLFLLDTMHLFYQGIMKKLIVYWTSGKLPIRLPCNERLKLSARLEYLKQFVPCEFQRKPRAIKYIAKWKATELRFFLLYCGSIVLKGILTERLYKHFLLLHVACRILCSSELALKRNAYAKVYLKTFFLTMREYYGAQSQVMNVHNLIHVADDALNMQCNLSQVSAFPFENVLGTVMKKGIRTQNRPLAQICRRLHEQQSIKKKVVLPLDIEILKYGRTFMDNNNSIHKLKIRGFTVSINAPDNKVILKSGEILQINEMHCPDNDVHNITIIGYLWNKKSSVFTYPCDSKHLKMWELTNKPSSTILRCKIQCIENKMVMLTLPLVKCRNGNVVRYDRKFVIPMLHS